MGGCCSSSQKFQLHGTPVYNYCPPALDEHESTTPRESSFSTRLLIDVNLDTSIPDTYRSPPTPIPFDVVLGIPQSTNMGSSDQAYQKTTLVKVKIFDHVAEDTTPTVESPKKAEVEFQTSKSHDCSTMEEEDICPTCFEEYDTENPRIVTKCNHQFHLSCILEWMERSNTCPICSQAFYVPFVCVSHPGSPAGPMTNMTKYKLRKPHAKLMGPEFDNLASTLCCFLASCHR